MIDAEDREPVDGELVSPYTPKWAFENEMLLVGRMEAREGVLKARIVSSVRDSEEDEIEYELKLDPDFYESCQFSPVFITITSKWFEQPPVLGSTVLVFMAYGEDSGFYVTGVQVHYEEFYREALRMAKEWDGKIVIDEIGEVVIEGGGSSPFED